MLKRSMILFLLVALVSFHCRKPERELKKLPELTQTGAGTLGCLVNGDAFLPGNGPYSGNAPLSCVYEFTNGGYYLKLSASDSTLKYLEGIHIYTNTLLLHEGETVPLEGFGKAGVGAAEYFTMGTDSKYHEYTTTPDVTGELHIMKLDEAAQLISGTFWFDAVFADGIYKSEKIHVREGRFDMHYSN